LYTAILPTAAELRAFYAGYYQASSPAVPPFVTGRLDEIVAGFASFRATNRLLDIGFGAGTLLAAAQRGGWTVCGTELSAPAVDAARGRGYDVVLGSLDEGAFAGQSFDVVTAVEVIEHLTDPLELLTHAAAVLRPGGLLWMTTPHGRGISARMLGERWSVVSPPEHIQWFSVRGMRGLLRRAGFRSMRFSTRGTNPSEIVSGCRGEDVSADERVHSSYRWNERLSSGRSARTVKSVANAVLSATRLGDSLVVRATT
jgi:SAM-dependent methyltransferase